ncbi:MAG: CoA transferase, partial [Actinomycetota bacterium]
MPLDGLRVVEFATIVAGPSTGKYLADFGAEVIKV